MTQTASERTSLSSPPTITVHWLERSRSQRILWLLEECRLPYDIKTYKRVNGLAPPEMLQIHPLGKAPIVAIKYAGRPSQLVLAESGAIFEYFSNHFAPHLAPKRYEDDGSQQLESQGWQRYRYYMHYTEGSLMSLLMRMHDTHALKGPEVDKIKAKLDRDLTTHLTFLESEITSSPRGGQYLCGETLSAADLMMLFPLMVIQSTMGGLGKYPELEAYVRRFRERPSCQSAAEKAERASGEKYTLV